MPILAYLSAAILIGVAVALQPLINAVLARATGSAFSAATISIGVAFLSALVMLTVTGKGDTSRATLAAVPWWVYLAGLAGTLYVTGGVVIAPVTGAFLFFACVIAVQLVGAILADNFGAFGVAVRPISALRIVGVALVLVGAVLAQRG